MLVAEATSLVTNLGTHGVGYINGDLTVGFARLPVGDWIGVQADRTGRQTASRSGRRRFSTSRAPSDPV